MMIGMPTKKATNRKAQRKQEIWDIAGKLFAKKGYERTTTRNISKAIGVSNGGLYYYCGSKESLLFEILDKILSSGLDAITKIEKSDKSLKEKLAAIINWYTRYYALDINNIKLLGDQQKHCVSSRYKQKLIKKQRDYLKVLVKILEGLKEQGEMTDIDPTVAAFAFFGMVHWIYRWYNPNGKVKPDQLAEIYVRIFTKGIFSGRAKS
jgi:AcrR family transcriptional regulator